jgi:hexosaminidase
MHNILPLPNGEVKFTGGSIPLPPALRAASVSYGALPQGVLEVFAQRTGVTLDGDSPLRFYRNEKLPEEGYHLHVTRERGIQVEAASDRGVCWALTTLYTLTEGGSVPCCDVTDAPRFPYRGVLLDSVRHFFPVETVKAFIEAVSLAKINALHWVLTNDQGWRIETKRFPALHGQCGEEYYTQSEIAGVVSFAKDRGVEVIPEIDLPGHTTSILSVYPELGCAGKKVRLGDAPGIYSVILCPGNEGVFGLLLPLLEEVAALFPSRYIHLGGDEAPKGEWEKCPKCQRRMAEEGLATPEELQGWFTARLAAHLRGLGKRVICWNESLLAENLPQAVPDLTIQYWAEMHAQGSARRFWEAGGPVIFSDYLNVYLDQPHGFNPLRRVYDYAPGLPGFRPENAPPALGLEACVWTEYIPAPEKLAQMAFPRAYALAEAAWTRPGRKDYGDFRRRLGPWLAKNPGMGFTPPEQADPKPLASYQQRFSFVYGQATAPRPENNGGAGGAIAPAFLRRWLKWYFL